MTVTVATATVAVVVVTVAVVMVTVAVVMVTVTVVMLTVVAVSVAGVTPMRATPVGTTVVWVPGAVTTALSVRGVEEATSLERSATAVGRRPDPRPPYAAPPRRIP